MQEAQIVGEFSGSTAAAIHNRTENLPCGCQFSRTMRATDIRLRGRARPIGPPVARLCLRRGDRFASLRRYHFGDGRVCIDARSIESTAGKPRIDLHDNLDPSQDGDGRN